MGSSPAGSATIKGRNHEENCLVSFFVIFSLGCSDAFTSAVGSSLLGTNARITCHSGGVIIFDGCSTGKVHSEAQSDGYYFRDAETNRLVEVSGECFIDYDAPCPTKSVRPAQQ